MKKLLSKFVIALAPPVLLYALQSLQQSYLHLYFRYDGFDDVVHFLGGIAMGITGILLLRIAEEEKWLKVSSRVVSILLVVGFVSLMANLWEFHEFLMDRYLGTHTQASIADTMFDMFLGMAGSLVSGLLLLLRKK